MLIKSLLSLLLFCGSCSAAEFFIDCDEAQLFCKSIGQGAPLVVIHGGPGLSHDYLLPQMSRLAESNQLIFYDQRGCGRSTGVEPAEKINVETYVEDLETLRCALQLEKISILGHSWGGFLAMRYAIAYPERVEKLILSNAMPASSDELALFFQEWQKSIAPYSGELAKLCNSEEFKEGDPLVWERYYRLIFALYCHSPEKADLLNLKMTKEALQNGMRTNERLCQNTFEQPYDLHGALEKLQIPTLILHGDDELIPPTAAASLHKSIRGSKYLLLEQCGHFPYVEKPAEYFSLIEEFLLSRK